MHFSLVEVFWASYVKNQKLANARSYQQRVMQNERVSSLQNSECWRNSTTRNSASRDSTIIEASLILSPSFS